MSISQNGNRIRVESAAKNGILGSQAGLAADQVRLDTAIAVNNGNLEASPTLKRRHIIIRRGQTDEEQSLITGVDVDGVTCTVQDSWDDAPALGDSYDVAYRLEDLATVNGLDFETDSRQWVLPSKRLIVGIGTTTFGFLGMSNGQVLRLADRGANQSSFLINDAGRFHIGTIKNDKVIKGACLVFTNDVEAELVMEFNGTAVGRLYDFTFVSARTPDGINGLRITVSPTADVKWAHGQHYGMDTPFKKKFGRIRNFQQTVYSTKADLMNSPMWSGWMKSEIDQAVYDDLQAEPDTSRVRLMIEG